jgi:hypothetical protein
VMRSTVRMVTTCVGSAMVAPASNSPVSTETGSNQYSVWGGEQKVTPVLR